MEIKNGYLPKKIGITGSTGFLGANFLLKLINSEDYNSIQKIKSFYSSTRWNPLLLDINDKKIEFEKLDILNYEQCIEKTKDLDCVVHFAAMVSFSKKDLGQLWRINVEGTENILRAAIENKIKRFVLISSISILNHAIDDKILTEEDIGTNEQTNKKYHYHSFNSKDEIVQCHKLWKEGNKSFLKKIKLPYHDTKLASYVIAKELVKDKDIQLVTVLPGTVLGKGDNHYSITKLVDKVYKNSLFVTLPGKASYVHVEDLSNGIYLSMVKGKKDEDYIISGNIEDNLPYPFFMKSIAKKLKRLTKKIILSRFLVLPSFLSIPVARFLEFIYPSSSITEGMVKSGYSKSVLSIEKAEKTLGYKPVKSFDDMIDDLCKDFLEREISEYIKNKKHFMMIRNLVCSNWVKKNAKLIVNYDKDVEDSPRKVYLVNHPTTYDFFTLVHLAKNNFYLPIEHTAFDIPIVGYFLHNSGFLPVFKKKEKNSEIINKMVDKIKKGLPVLNSIRSGGIASGKPGRLRTGGAVIADLSKADIVPLHIYVEKDRLVKNFLITLKLKKAPIVKFHNALVFVSFLKPLKWSDYHKDNMTKEDYYNIMEKVESLFKQQDELIERKLKEEKSYYDAVKRQGGSDIFINF
ncbi:MAG: NAD-dependent epimerase/dehydratase family protein [Spirochaetales bacterium]|nr:NAD-dependent epimerase/dehydratase family protein [Spirochaetales bacterium]